MIPFPSMASYTYQNYVPYYKNYFKWYNMPYWIYLYKNWRYNVAKTNSTGGQSSGNMIRKRAVLLSLFMYIAKLETYKWAEHIRQNFFTKSIYVIKCKKYTRFRQGLDILVWLIYHLYAGYVSLSCRTSKWCLKLMAYYISFVFSNFQVTFTINYKNFKVFKRLFVSFYISGGSNPPACIGTPQVYGHNL